MNRFPQHKSSWFLGIGILVSIFISGNIFTEIVESEQPILKLSSQKIDSESEFSNIYYNILKPKCGNSACHGVVFEPNFSSVQSAYATMVYHPIVKNSPENEFKYRVVPYKTEESVLFERLTNCCFVNKDDRMPQSKIGSKLADQDLNAIKDWIMNGAKDIFGNIPEEPNSESEVTEQWVLGEKSMVDYSSKEYRRDRMPFRSMLIPSQEQIWLCVRVADDITATDKLQNCRFKLSQNQDDFANAKEFKAEYQLVNQQKCWSALVNAKDLEKGKTLYFRFYANDGDHKQDCEYPNKETGNSTKRTWSMEIGDKI